MNTNTSKSTTGNPKGAGRKVKWTIIPNKAGYGPSRHVLRRLSMKAKRKGLVSEWPYVYVLDSGALRLVHDPDKPGSGEVLIAVPSGKGTGTQAKWDMLTENEYLDREEGQAGGGDDGTDAGPEPEQDQAVKAVKAVKEPVHAETVAEPVVS